MKERKAICKDGELERKLKNLKIKFCIDMYSMFWNAGTRDGNTLPSLEVCTIIEGGIYCTVVTSKCDWLSLLPD